MTADSQDARALLSAAAVRSAAQRMLLLAREKKLDDWQVDFHKLETTADFVAAVIRERYPSLDPPLHARWRHFEFSGHDLWQELSAQHLWKDAAARARAAFDLAITSVLLDAGAGSGWHYQDKVTGQSASRSEGLALASLRWFSSGAMSANSKEALRADALALAQIKTADLNAAFQISEANPLLGAEGRVHLLNRVGVVLQSRPDLFALVDSPRPGGLFDALSRRAVNGALPAAVILEMLLDGFGSIWEGRPVLQGVPLGDCWPHPALTGNSSLSRFVPLHKLSQWLAYSLIEPLQQAGIKVIDVDALTGLAEYRNGGLFVDCDVLIPRQHDDWTKQHHVSDPFVVGWRSLTVALLDELAPLVRTRLNVTRENFPLAKLLEGGTWAAGRMAAQEKRADGSPPFRIQSDGTVF